MSIKVLLVDDHGIIRQGLHSLLEKQPDMEVVGEAVDGREALIAVDEKQPDVVVMDITMPNLNGVDATRQIIVSSPNVRIIALSIHFQSSFRIGYAQCGGVRLYTKGVLIR